MKRTITAVVVLLVLGIGVWVLFRNLASPASKDAKPPQTITVAERTIEQFVTTTGTVQPSVLTEVRSEVSGRIVRVSVKEGETVKNGISLLELDPSQLQSDTTAAELAIESANLRAGQLLADLKRKEQLAAEKLIPEKEITDAKAEAGRAAIDAKIEQARLDKLKNELAKTTILAPSDGTVLNLAAKEGIVITGASSVSEGTVLMQIADLLRLEVESSVNEIDIARLSVGMPVEVTFDSLPDLVTPGRLTFIAPSAGAKPGAAAKRTSTDQNSETNFRMIVSLDNVGAGIKPGMSANMKILAGRADSVPSVELSAVFVDKSGSYVFRQQEGKFSRITVQTGFSDRQYVQIRSGVTAGDVLATEKPSQEFSADLSEPDKK